MKKIISIWVLLCLLLVGCAAEKEPEKTGASEPSEPWITFDTTVIEANEYGSFDLSGTSESSFTMRYKKTNRTILVKDNQFKVQAMYDKDFPDELEISFERSNDDEPIVQRFTLDYSKYIAKNEADEQLAKDVEERMPPLLETIVAESEGQILQIEPVLGNYRKLKVVVPLSVKYERNGEKKRIMDTLGHDIQARTAEVLYPDGEKIPYLYFRYNETNELLGSSQLLYRNRFTLSDAESY